MHPLVGLGGGWGQNVLNLSETYNGNKTPIQKRVLDDDSDTDSNNEMLMNSETNWLRFLIVESASEDLLLQKLPPFAIQKGFQAVAGTLKSIKRQRWLLLGGVRQKGPGPKPALNKPIY